MPSSSFPAHGSYEELPTVKNTTQTLLSPVPKYQTRITLESKPPVAYTLHPFSHTGPPPRGLARVQVRRVKALRTVGKRAAEDSGAESEGGGGGGPEAMEGVTTASGGEGTDGEGGGGATAAARAKRGTRRKNKERKVL